MLRIYLVFGFLACMLLGYANYTGWVLVDALTSGQWSPRGQHSYHK
jgi:hypothetical protein